MATLGAPIKLLMEAEKHKVTVEVRLKALRDVDWFRKKGGRGMTKVGGLHRRSTFRR